MKRLIPLAFAITSVTAQAAPTSHSAFNSTFGDDAFLRALSQTIYDSNLQNKAVIFSAEPNAFVEQTRAGFYPKPTVDSKSCIPDYVAKTQTCTITKMQVAYGTVPSNVSNTTWLAEATTAISDNGGNVDQLTPFINQMLTAAGANTDGVDFEMLGTFKLSATGKLSFKGDKITLAHPAIETTSATVSADKGTGTLTYNGGQLTYQHEDCASAGSAIAFGLGNKSLTDGCGNAVDLYVWSNVIPPATMPITVK